MTSCMRGGRRCNFAAIWPVPHGVLSYALTCCAVYWPCVFVSLCLNRHQLALSQWQVRADVADDSLEPSTHHSLMASLSALLQVHQAPIAAPAAPAVPIPVDSV